MKRSSVALLLSASALCLAAMPAVAEDAETDAAAAPDAAGSTGLQEIVVTATRSGKTDIQKTPIAVTAFNSESIAEHGILTALDLNGLAPNVSIGGRNGTGASQGAITIRGIGVDANPPAPPAVGVYVDDVYIPASYGNLLGTYDLSQLEILRGPQGTLFGRNTIGGALTYTSVKPMIGDFNGFVEGTYGNQGHDDLLAGVNVPLNDWAALRVSGAFTNRDGYVHDLLNDVERGSEHNDDARVQLRLQPTSDLLIDLKVERVHQESNGAPAIVTGFNYNSILGQPFAATRALDAFISPGFYESVGDGGPDSFESTLKLAQGVATYDITPDIKVKSITAYSQNKDLFINDNDHTPLDLFQNSKGLDVNDLFTQELQLFGKILDGRLHFTVGAYYYDEDSSNSGSYASIFHSPPANTTFGNYDVKTTSYAGYGQLTYDITDQLSAIGGLRYTRDDVNASNAFAIYAVKTESFNNTSPLLGINFQLTPDILLYAKYSRGFRAGNFSPNLFGSNPFGPEKLDSSEAGARMQFFNHRVRLNPTVFLTQWKDIQFNALVVYLPPVARVPTPAPVVENAGNAHTKGAELESEFQVTNDLTVTANAALFQGHYTSLLQTPFGTPVANVNLSTPLKRAPKASFSVGGRYDVPIGESDIALSADYTWQGHQRSATSNNDNVEIGAYGLLNARLTFTAPDDRFSVALFCNNLLDRKYLIGGTTWGNGGLIPETEEDVGRPRDFGLTARYNF